VLDSTLQRQVKDLFPNLTVKVVGVDRLALVYSLTWSAREAPGKVAFLAEIDKLAAPVDQLWELLAGDEVLHVLHRRVLGAKLDSARAARPATPAQKAPADFVPVICDTDPVMAASYAQTWPGSRSQSFNQAKPSRSIIPIRSSREPS
jgi:hypothetical protein